MHVVGIDLAWGERQPTGVAVLDAEGRLVHVTTTRTDDEIVAAVTPYVEGDCLVAVDAPLVVTNPTGNRVAEAELNRDFARFDAGAHPSNTGKPEFRDGTRGARICGRLKLDMNPRSGRNRRAIEVYPHPATIALFRLGRTLKYKNKPGRDLEALRGELLVLMGLLEGLATAEPPLVLDDSPWPALRVAVESAARKSELRVVEDQVDAVVCAYVALFTERHPEQRRVYGDPEQGYIVTPRLPEDLAPTARGRRSAPVAEDPARSAVREYAAQHSDLRAAADQAVGLLTAVLDDAGINYLTVTGRAKSVASFAAKAARTVEGRPVYADPLVDITDQVGVRVITYVHADVTAVAELLTSQLLVLDDRDMGQETAREGRFGYASRHLLVQLDPAREPQLPHDLLVGRRVQVQVRTVLQHAWAEFEHDIRYKGTIPDEHVPDFDRRFTLAAGLLELADREFSTIRARLQSAMAPPPSTPAPTSASTPADDDPRISARELAAFLAGQYADAGWSRTDHYAWISGLLLELGITSLQELGEVLRPLDAEGLVARMGYKYPPGAVRRLDDALLAAFGEAYVTLRGNAHREQALRARLERLAGS